MRRFLKVLLILIVLLIAAAVAVPFLVPAETIKNEALAQIKAHTGRDVTMGKARFSLFPTLAIDAEDVKIGNPGWTNGGTLAEMKTLKIGIELMPLLHGEYRLKNFTLEKPVITLIKRQGRTNWDFSQPSPATASAAPAAAGGAHAASASRGIPDLHLEKISISDGTVTYKDDASDKTEVATGINLAVEAPDLNEKAEIKFSATYGGQKADVTLSLEKPLGFMDGQTTEVALKASYDKLDFTWTGTATAAKGGTPKITGTITIPSLNTADFLQEKSTSSAKAAPESTAAQAPRAEGASHWSDAPIRLDGLRRADADVTVSIGKLTLPKTSLDNVVTHIRLTNGVLQLQADPINAYGGVINLALAANSSGGVNISFAAAHAEAEPLLHDFAGYDKLSGTIDLQTKISGAGGSQRAIVGSLAGNSSLAMKNGKLKGVNIANLLNKLSGAQGSEEDSTAFSEFSGTFTIAHGVATTNDLKLVSPLLRMSGTGDADLPGWQAHFLLKPMLVASRGKDGGEDSGIVVPVAVDGPLDHPRYKPDFQAALQENLKDPAKLKENVKNLKDQLLQGGKISSDSLKGLLR